MLKIKDILAGNLNTISKRNFDFKPNLDIPTDMFRIEKGKADFSTVKVNVDGITKYINSKYDPVKEALSEIRHVEVEPGGALFCFGFGLGYHVRELLKVLPKNGKLYVIEPSEDFFIFVLKSIDLTDILEDSRFEVFFLRDELKMKELFTSKVSMEQTIFSKVFCWPVYKELYPKECKLFINTYQYLITHHVTDANTTLVLTPELHKNYLNNIKFVINSYGIGEFIGSYKNKPAIIVAAGPSLSKNVGVLKEAKGKVLIIGAYSAKGALIKNDIAADIITTIDPRQTIYERDKGIPLVQNEPLLALTSSERFLLEAATNNIIFNQGAEKEYLPEQHYIPKGPTVAIFSLSFAIAIGADPIIFVGQDLAFTDDKGHAEGTIHELVEVAGNRGGGKHFYVDDIYGNKVLTSQTFSVFKTQIESMVAQHKDRTFIDATEGGAYIEGTKVMHLKETLEKYITPDLDVNKYLEKVYTASKLFKSLDSKKAFLDKLKKALVNMKDLKKDSSEMMEYSKKAAKSVKYNSSYKANDIKRYDKRVQKFKEKIIAMDFETSFMIFILSLHNRKLQSLGNREEEEFLKYVNFYSEFSRNYFVATNDTIPLFEKSINEIEEMLKNEEEVGNE